MRSWGSDPMTAGAAQARQPDHDGRPAAEPSWSRCCSRRPARAAPRRGCRPNICRSCRTPTASPPRCATGSRARRYQIRAKYLIGADGGNSKVADDIGLPMEGKMGVGGSINILFKADLTKYVAHRPSVLYWVLQPGSNVGGIGMGLVRMVGTWDEWLIVWGYDITQPAPVVTARDLRAARAPADRRRRDPARDHVVVDLDGQPHARHALSAPAACSAWATPSTAIRRATGSAPTPRSRTPSTWPGSWRWC